MKTVRKVIDSTIETGATIIPDGFINNVLYMESKMTHCSAFLDPTLTAPMFCYTGNPGAIISTPYLSTYLSSMYSVGVMDPEKLKKLATFSSRMLCATTSGVTVINFEFSAKDNCMPASGHYRNLTDCVGKLSNKIDAKSLSESTVSFDLRDQISGNFATSMGFAFIVNNQLSNPVHALALDSSKDLSIGIRGNATMNTGITSIVNSRITNILKKTSVNAPRLTSNDVPQYQVVIKRTSSNQGDSAVFRSDLRYLLKDISSEVIDIFSLHVPATKERRNPQTLQLSLEVYKNNIFHGLADLSTFNIRMFYTSSFSYCQTCSSQYMRWRNSLEMQEAVCRKDYYNMKDLFGICDAIKPVFTEQPSVYPQKIFLGQTFGISGGMYKSQNPLITLLYKDGNMLERLYPAMKRKRRNVDYTDGLPRRPTGYKSFYQASMDKQGVYQVVLRDEEGKNVTFSEKVHVQFVDVSNSKIEMTLANEKWDESLKDAGSDRFKSLSNNIKIALSLKFGSWKMYNSKTSINVTQDKFEQKDGKVVSTMTLYLYPVQNTTKKLYCTSLPSFLSDGQLGEYTVTDVKVHNYDCCMVSTVGSESYKGVYDFGVTLSSEVAHVPCAYKAATPTLLFPVNAPYIANRACFPNMEFGSQWADPDLSGCPPYSLTTQALEQLNGTTVKTDNVKETSERLKQTVVRGNITVPVDIKLVSDVLTSIVQVNASDSEVADNVVQTVSEVLNASPDLIAESEIQYQSSQSILRQLDDLAKGQVVGRGEQVMRKSQNVALLAFRNSALKNVTVFSPDFSSSKISGNFFQIDLQQINGALNDSQIFNQDATAFLPSSLFNLASEYGDFVHAFVFNNSNLFLTANQLNNVTDRKAVAVNRTVQSRVLSVTVGQRKITKLPDVVSMTFKKNIVFPKGYDKEICHFWDESKATDIPGVVGGWSSEGCVTVLLENGQFIRCECDHLTNFALILDTSQTGLNILALKVVTWIGCAISIASLVLTILTFLIFRKTLLTGKLPPKILIGLCFSLLCTMIIFLAGVEQTKQKIGCQVVAGLIQYFLLATFCWMAVEGINLYRSVVDPLTQRGSGKKKFMIGATLFAVGLPLVITVISAAAEPNNYGPVDENDSYQL